MKKILLGIAVAMAAVSLQAASITWGAANITQSTIEGAGAISTGYSGFFFIVSESVTLESVTSALSSGDTSVLGLATYSKDAVYNSNTGRSSIASSGNGDYAAGTTISAFQIIIDTTVANAGNASSYLVGIKASTSEDVVTVTAASSGAMAFSLASQLGNTAWQAVAVPEPTSGLLMLLGMAGLALRRRRA